MTNLGEHDGQEGLVERILGKLAAAGIDPDGLTPTHLSGVDEFHLGGGMVTDQLGAGVVAPTQIVARRYASPRSG